MRPSPRATRPSPSAPWRPRPWPTRRSPSGATASSGLPVSFSSTAAGTVPGDEVTLGATGTCTITADQAGNANWNAAPQVPQTFDIGKLAQAALSVDAPTAGTFGGSMT